MKRVYIQGLIKFINKVRFYTIHGATVVEKQRVIKEIEESILKVKNICQQHRIKPSDLPQPTYQAYKYLLTFDPSKIQIKKNEVFQDQKLVRINKVLSFCDSIHKSINDLSLGNEKNNSIKQLEIDIRNEIERIEKIAVSQSSTIQALPERTFKAYQWLKFLSEEENLIAHISTHQSILENVKVTRRKKWGNQKRYEVFIFFISPLYSIRADQHLIRIFVNEGFVGAPEVIINAINHVITNGKSNDHIRSIRRYSRSDDFLSISNRSIKRRSNTNSNHTKGEYYDLAKIYDKVRSKYFKDGFNKPTLMWNNQITRRKLGHYNSDTDTVMISIALDNHEIPDYLIEYVMYHELLHKQLGFVHRDNKRYAHTCEFHCAEKRFEQYALVREYLKEWRKLG